MDSKPIAFFIILNIIFSNTAPAQNQRIDSLRQIVKNYPLTENFTAKDTLYFNSATALCDSYFKEYELDSMLALADRTLPVLDRALSAVKAPAAVKSLEQNKMWLFRYRGIYFKESGDYVNALKDFHQYLNQAEKIGSVLGIGSAHTAIAFCHRDLEDYTKSYEFAIKSCSILKGTRYQDALANNYSVIAAYYDQVRLNIDSAIIYSKMAREIYAKSKNRYNETNTIFDIVEYYSSMYQSDSVLYYLKQAEPFVFEEQQPELLLHFQIKMGEALYLSGNNAQALSHLNQAAALAKELESPVFEYNTEMYRSLVLAAKGDRLASHKSMKAAFNAYTEDVNSDKVRELNTTQLNFDFERKQARANLDLERQKRTRDLSLAALALGIIGGLFVYRLYRQSKKAARILAEKNQQIEASYHALKATQEQLVLTEKQREAQSVRVRIARDIHDELGAGLTKITIMSDVLRKKLSDIDPESQQLLQRIGNNSKGVSSSLSEIVWAVNPTHDSLESLSNYLKNYAIQFLDGTDIQGIFDFPLELPEKSISPELKRNIFLVLKEALNNAAKYAQATEVKVSFSTDGGVFRLGVEDNGIGFDLQATGENAGNGLSNMKTRMEQLNCQWVLKTAPGQGCVIEASGSLEPG